MVEETLSDKMKPKPIKYGGWFPTDDVKEFIKELKEDFWKEISRVEGPIGQFQIQDIIDKRAGDRLV